MLEDMLVGMLAVILNWLLLPFVAYAAHIEVCITRRTLGRVCCGRRNSEQSERGA